MPPHRHTSPLLGASIRTALAEKVPLGTLIHVEDLSKAADAAFAVMTPYMGNTH